MTIEHVLVEYKYLQFIVKENMMFHSFDLNPVTLILKLDLDMIKMCLHTKNEVTSYSGSKVIA